MNHNNDRNVKYSERNNSGTYVLGEANTHLTPSKVVQQEGIHT